jgi:hypothetical protein
MARKGWDALSDKYRKRLLNKGITRSAYESGVSLNVARGHLNPQWEAYVKRVNRFVEAFGVPHIVYIGGKPVPTGDDEKQEIQRLRDMGIQDGQTYMDYRREMTKLYVSGDYKQAETMYKQRDRKTGLPDYMWWYHGMFGG